MRSEYCDHGPDLPQSDALRASATENSPSLASGSPLRFTRQRALRLSPAPSNHSLKLSILPDACTTPSAPSPQSVARLLMTAIDCKAAIGVNPTSMPCMIATMAFSGVSSPFGAMPALQTADAIRHAPSKSCGTIALTLPPAGNDGRRLLS